MSHAIYCLKLKDDWNHKETQKSLERNLLKIQPIAYMRAPVVNVTSYVTLINYDGGMIIMNRA